MFSEHSGNQKRTFSSLVCCCSGPHHLRVSCSDESYTLKPNTHTYKETLSGPIRWPPQISLITIPAPVANVLGGGNKCIVRLFGWFLNEWKSSSERCRGLHVISVGREEPRPEKSSTLVMKTKHTFSRMQPSRMVSVKLSIELCNVEGVYGCENCLGFFLEN